MLTKIYTEYIISGSAKVRLPRAVPTPTLSVVLPCLNEAETLKTCILKIQQTFFENNIQGEIIIADNGSTDDSQAIALRCGARLVSVHKKGYGNTLQGGIMAARGQYIIMGAADDSYNFFELPRLLEQLEAGYTLVIGNRFKGGIAKQAMPLLHRYLGNPMLSFIGRLFYNIQIGDFHCGLRGFHKKEYERWNLRSPGTEFASEMVVKASLNQAKITEVPVTLSRNGRSRAPQLRTWQDGWRHLHFLLVYSPRWLFIIPGILISVLGLLICLWLLPHTPEIRQIQFDIHFMLVGAVALIIGLQLIALGLISHINGAITTVFPKRRWTEQVTKPSFINKMIFGGLSFLLLGGLGLVYSFQIWEETSFGRLDPQYMLRVLIPFILLLTIGVQLISTGFMISILSGHKR
ncbi:glycosyltransferase family 2 protein [Tellurirhabdus bombi]|uniref:glycosyltransferase family 2 protein n=1 Tax=Tellurirhabdus bombi TaxID=2907205 RepID=UPI001F26089D|nr:glycosyltransferase family 2 protein [Tellurirhabdus bombi]